MPRCSCKSGIECCTKCCKGMCAKRDVVMPWAGIPWGHEFIIQQQIILGARHTISRTKSEAEKTHQTVIIIAAKRIQRDLLFKIEYNNNKSY